MKRLVLLDRDGTINVEKHYLSAPDLLELLPGAAEGIRLMRQLGLAAVVVTNQSAIGRGYFSLHTLARIHQRLQDMLAHQQAELDRIYVCPHRPEQGCHCRKPEPGLAWRAAHELRGDLSASFVVGDKTCDIELGKRIGATTILVRSGYGDQVALSGSIQADYMVANLLEAVPLIKRLVRVDGERSAPDS
jgi:D-glycero-D-manno-heptose 1,7-bisphosphate phosphatase